MVNRSPPRQDSWVQVGHWQSGQSTRSYNMSIRTVVLLAAVLCALPLSGAAAQQAADSVRGPVPALTESVNVPATQAPAPASLMLQRQQPLAPIRLAPAPSLAA